MAEPIHMWLEAERDGGIEVRRLRFEGVEGPQGPKVDVWWRICDAPELPVPPVLDTFVGGHVLWAAAHGQDLVVHGAVSPGGMYNLGQLLEMRHAFSPERYPRVIRVIPDEVKSVAREDKEKRTAVATLSGGLDSTFTVVRHGKILPPELAYRIRGLVMVYGHDAPLDRSDRFEIMRKRAEPVAALLGVPLYTVLTNSMQTGGLIWPQSAIPLYASALAFFSAIHGVGLVGAGMPHG
jgi:hypothetical protein